MLKDPYHREELTNSTSTLPQHNIKNTQMATTTLHRFDELLKKVQTQIGTYAATNTVVFQGEDDYGRESGRVSRPNCSISTVIFKHLCVTRVESSCHDRDLF